MNGERSMKGERSMNADRSMRNGDAATRAEPATPHGGASGVGGTEAGVARTYARLAPLYDLLFGQVLEPGRRRMTAVVRALAPTSLLEVGVGTGLALSG